MNDLTKLDSQLPSEWRISEQGLRAIKTAVAMSNTKHGLVASIPIVCKGNSCPYADACPMIPMNLATVGERCPVEIATIIDRFNKYVKQLRIDPDNIVDLGLVKNLVDVEIQLARADRRCAITADIVEQVIAVVTERGEAYYRPEISKAAEYKLKLISEHGRILSLLNATRKDKAANKMNISIDASNYAAQLLRRKAMLESSIEAEVIRDDTE